MAVNKTWSGVSAADREALRLYNEMKSDTDAENLVGQMKVAAIDAYMQTHQGGMWANALRINANALSAFMPGQYWHLFPGGAYLRNHAVGDDFVYARPCVVRRNLCGGEGGEAYHAVLLPGSMVVPTIDKLEPRDDKSLDFVGIFRSIDSVLENWWGLPETGRGTQGDFGPATEVADSIADAAGELGLDKTYIGGSGRMDTLLGNAEGRNTAPSPIWSYTETVAGGNDDGFKCAAFWRWRVGFVQKLPQVVGACAQISMWLATAVAAQARAWHIAKADVARAVENARDNFETVAFDGGGLSANEARFYKAAVHIATSYLPKPASTVYDAFGVASYLDKHIDGMTTAPDCNYESVMAKFKASLTKIEHHIADSEKEIAASAVSLLKEVRQDRTLFELSYDGPGGDISIDGPGNINLRYDPVKVVTDILTEVADILNSCATTIEENRVKVKTVFQREHGIGLGQYGPGLAIEEVAEMLGEMLRNLAFWCSESVQAIWAVFYMMVQTNEEIRNDLLQKNSNLYYNVLPLHPDPASEFLRHNANLAGTPPEEPFDYVIKDLEERMKL